MKTISELARNKTYRHLASFTDSYVQAANDALCVTHFTCTVFNSDGRLFAAGEIDPDVFQFVDLEDPERTVYTLAELKALDTDQDWYTM